MSGKMKWAWLGVIALVMISASMLMQSTPVLAQATATSTPTTAATNTPTPTATAINTPRPMAQSISGYAQGYRVGQYGVTFDTTGSAFQAWGGNTIDLYSAAGRNTVKINGATGSVDFYGSVSSSNCGTVAVTNSATVVAPTGLTPTSGQVSMSAITADAARASILANTGGITVTVYSTALTPTANATPATVNYCVYGTH
jgi:hypothetical protein